jgi:hypothetical protein
MSFYERRAVTLTQLLLTLLDGSVRVYKRPAVENTWTHEQRGELLDSIYRGFPVGTLLFWSTHASLPTLDVVAGFRVPQRSTNSQFVRVLLDGYQRIYTFLAIFGPGLLDELQRLGSDVKCEEPFYETWVFETSEDCNDCERFRCLVGVDPSSSQLPLGIALDRSQVNRWIQRHFAVGGYARRVESMCDRFRDYTMSVAVLVTENIDDANVVACRMNSKSGR